MDSPLVHSALALFAGNFVGAISDRVITVVDARVRMIEALELGEKTGSLLDTMLGIFLHTGLIALGTDLVVKALPWLVNDAAAFTIFGIAMASATPHFHNHLMILNTVLFDEAIYSSETKRQKAFIESGPEPTPSEQ